MRSIFARARRPTRATCSSHVTDGQSAHGRSPPRGASRLGSPAQRGVGAGRVRRRRRRDDRHVDRGGRDRLARARPARRATGEELDRFASLVRPAGPIPAESTAVHGIDDAAVARAPTFAMTAPDVSRPARRRGVRRPQRRVSTSPLLQHAFARAGILDTGRPASPARSMPSGCSSRLSGVSGSRRSARATGSSSTTRTMRWATCSRRPRSSGFCSREGIAPETVALDHDAYMRLRSRGDTRPASEPQIRRVFGLARLAGLVARTGRRPRRGHALVGRGPPASGSTSSRASRCRTCTTSSSG